MRFLLFIAAFLFITNLSFAQGALSGKDLSTIKVDALSDAEMQAHEIDYINVHGTSTPIGDPQEIKAIEKAFPCQRCGMAVIGLEVPHAHVHLVPIDTADDLNFTRPKLKPSQDELKDAQQKILQALNQ